MRRLASSLLIALAASAPLATASTAVACGGFFRAETPVDQSAQRMIFKRLTASRLEAYFEIRFSGDPTSFAWVLPVPGNPQDKAIVDAAVFEALDVATAPQVTQPIVCEALGVPPGESSDAGFDNSGGGDPEVSSPRVTVIDREVVGEYDVATLEAETGADLVAWLRKNDFRVTEEMTPFIDLYIGQGLNFLAVKLKPGAGIDGIRPLKMTYDARGPMVPLKLAAVAAQPETGVKIFYLGDQRVTPSNTPELTVPAGHLAFDHATQTGNWPAAVARTIDDGGGEGLVVDFAGPVGRVRTSAEENPVALGDGADAAAPRAALDALLSGTAYLTRFYARYSPEEMGVDLAFEAAPSLGDVERVRSLPEVSCETEPPPADPCDFQACGLGGYCVMTTDAAGAAVPACACVDGAAARAVRDDVAPGGVRVSCVDVRINVDPVRLPDQVVETPPVVGPPLLDPCAADPCGENGECFALNGHQTCLCERGFVAVAVDDGAGGLKATCRTPNEDVPDDFYRRRLPEPRLPYPRAAGGGNATSQLSDDGCTQGSPAQGARNAAWALLLALPLLARRRGRR
jgi:hypothetical protein